MKRTTSILLAVSAIVLGANASAQPAGFPTKAVRVVIPFPPGGPADALGRLYGEKLGKIWSQPVVADNRAGAGGNVASEHVAKQAPDGYTLLLGASSHVTNAALYRNLNYDPIKDFTPVSQIAYYSLVLVTHPSLPVRDLRELVAYAKSNPGKLTFSSAGSGTPTHLANELLRGAAGIDIVHAPYKGAAPATTDLIGGQVQAMFNNPLSALPHVKSGKLRAIATTGLARSPTTPDLPTVAESGYPGFETGTWFAFLAPAGLPKDVLARLAADIAQVSAMSDVRERLLVQGIEPRATTPDELGEIMRTDLDKWGRVIRAANIKAD